jgi:hypothetical protein
MSIKAELINQIFSEAEGILGVFEILSSNEIKKFRITDEKAYKPSEILPFLNNLISESRKICSAFKDNPIEMIANSADYIFLITTIKTDGSSLIIMLPKDGNIGLAKVIAQKVVAQLKTN